MTSLPPLWQMVVGVNVAVVVVILATRLLSLRRRDQRQKTPRKAMVLVLGDVGRSPRMQYHALSLATAGINVDVVGYAGSACLPALVAHERVTLTLMKPFNLRLPRVFFLVYALLKIAVQITQLALTLLSRRVDFLIVQNPPAIPTLVVVQLYCFLLPECRLIIDWHNFGYSILALSRGANSVTTRIAYWYERVCGRGAHANLCVTRAMQTHLRDTWHVDATVLYDRAPEHFRRLTICEQHDFLLRLHGDGAFESASDWLSVVDDDSGDDAGIASARGRLERTFLTERYVGEHGASSTPSRTARLVADRPRLIVSSTSWTPDEDFAVLLDAAVQYDALATTTALHLPQLLLVITGKGPQKAMYEARIAALQLTRVRIITAWLHIDDYPLLLGCADMGVCLHTSSSGLDLPMKVVDMFGCGLPVAAIGFPCLHELVQHGENGMVFHSSAELVQVWLTLFTDSSAATLDAMRLCIADFQRVRWNDSWVEHALPLFSE
jgi:beta-1,4-mannosyltransferase